MKCEICDSGEELESKYCYWCGLDTSKEDRPETWQPRTYLREISKTIMTSFTMCGDCSNDLFTFILRKHKHHATDDDGSSYLHGIAKA